MKSNGGTPSGAAARRRLAWPVVALLATAGWAAATTPEIAAAREDLRAAREALDDARRGLEAEVTVRPRLDLVARDDPPRPRDGDLDVRLGASLAWAPLASEILLHEARVLEAESRLVDARRDAVVHGLRGRVERARADADESAAEAAVRGAREEVARARAGAEGDLGLARAEVDLREALLDLADARRVRDALGRSAAADAGPERPDLRLPAPGDVRTLRAFRARERRASAAVAREARRRLDAFMPDLSLEAGYAGADAALSAGVDLAHGRPRARLEASWAGTPQERAWARVSLTLRLGSDGAAALATPDRAAATARADLAVLAEEIAATARADRAEARSRRSHWRVAEDRLALERQGGDPGRIARAEDVARREWLRFLRAADALAATLEVPLEVR